LVAYIIEERRIEARLWGGECQGVRRLLDDWLFRKRTKTGTKQSHIGDHLMLNDAVEVLCDFLPPILVVELHPIGNVESVYNPIN